MSEHSAPRCAALVGPYLSGKTTLMESILFVTGATGRKGSIKEGNTVGDSAQESRERQMSTELSAASCEYLGDRWTFLDCPGSIEFVQEGYNALTVADVAVVVCEPAVEKALVLAPLFRFLDEHAIPHMVFINKIDLALEVRVQDVVEALQAVSERPLVLRQLPIRDGETVAGYVDLASERAFTYKAGEASSAAEIPAEVQESETDSRRVMIESLADFDDDLLEKLLEDETPSVDEVYGHLAKNLRSDRIVPVFIGAGEHDHGVRRLLKALRHETPAPAAAAERLGIDPAAGEALAQVFKTYHLPHAGKLSLARIWRGEISDGATLNGQRVSGLFRLAGHHQDKLAKAGAGDVVALGRMEEVRTGDVLTPSGDAAEEMAEPPAAATPMFSLAVQAAQRADEVKLSGAIAKLREEDPSLSLEQNADTNEMVLWGQGEIHLLVAMDRLKNKYNLEVASHRPQVPYKETIRRSVSQHARFKRQTGGHGQFGDVHVDIKPKPRGAGFEFLKTVVGGNVPRQYIPSVENGVKEYMSKGPLGFPVVDIAVTLTDGQHHQVDSSDMAFKTAARMAMNEGMPKCDPVLLEPIYEVQIAVPTEFTSNVQRIVSSRRGQILGFDAKPGWKGWDEINVHMPQSEIHDLIVDLRSQTLGVGTYTWKFDHLQELTGRTADQIIQSRAEAEEATQ